MEFLEDKLGPVASNALSGINEVRNKQSRQGDAANRTKQQDSNAGKELVEMTQTISGHDSTRANSGDGSHNLFSPPPIGFRSDIIDEPRGHLDRSNSTAFDGRKSASDESLYQADGWSRLWFQRLLLLSLTRLLLFVRKIYEDFQGTKTHKAHEQAGYLLVSAAALFLPTIVYTIYRVSWYLQLTLPTFRISPELMQPGASSKQTTGDIPSGQASDKTQPTDALLSGSTTGRPNTELKSRTNSPTIGNEDDGLVTARQSPNPDEFQDSRSEQDLSVAKRPVRQLGANNGDQLAVVEASAQGVPKLESFDIDKLGDLPDKETTRVVIGTSEQLLHGVLYIFWQLKRQVDVLSYLVERACLWRKPRDSEREELNRLSITSDHLEWFEDFYAAFLAIVIEVYKLGILWSVGDDGPIASNSIGGGLKIGDGIESDAIKKGAQLVASLAPVPRDGVNNKDLLIISQLVVSSFVVLSLLVAVRRRDDGILHVGLSMIGWGSMFAARILIVAMAFVYIGWRFIVPLVLLHVFGVMAWIYKISIDSHNDEPSERVIEAMYDERVADEIEAIKLRPKSERDNQARATNSWSLMEHLVLLTQILFLFAIPSLFYWPILFNLKTHKRLFKYLLVILTQNFILIPSTWYMIAKPTPGQLYLLGAVAALSVVGFVFLSLYYCLKPILTECFAFADVKFNQAETCGIYYEFCSRVFKLPDFSKLTFTRLQNQGEKTVEEQTVARELED